MIGRVLGLEGARETEDVLALALAYRYEWFASLPWANGDDDGGIRMLFARVDRRAFEGGMGEGGATGFGCLRIARSRAASRLRNRWNASDAFHRSRLSSLASSCSERSETSSRSSSARSSRRSWSRFLVVRDFRLFFLRKAAALFSFSSSDGGIGPDATLEMRTAPFVPPCAMKTWGVLPVPLRPGTLVWFTVMWMSVDGV